VVADTDVTVNRTLVVKRAVNEIVVAAPALFKAPTDTTVPSLNVIVAERT
jgi:hypothetical protein